MLNIEKIVKDYSSKKLKEIVDEQSSSYHKDFIEYAKGELIKRGEIFQFDSKIQKQVLDTSDKDLKTDVEINWNSLTPEHLEIARNEYLKRGFKNELFLKKQINTGTNNVKKYPTLRVLAEIYMVFTFIAGLFVAVMAFTFFVDSRSEYTLIHLISGILVVLGLVTTSQLIKLFIDIEGTLQNSNDKSKFT